jgi:hypothetical protein
MSGVTWGLLAIEERECVQEVCEMRVEGGFRGGDTQENVVPVAGECLLTMAFYEKAAGFET